MLGHVCFAMFAGSCLLSKVCRFRFAGPGLLGWDGKVRFSEPGLLGELDNLPYLVSELHDES